MPKCIINSFHKTIPHSRILLSLSIVDNIILKINCNDIENNIENFHDLGGCIFCTLSYEKLVRDEQQTDGPILNGDEQKKTFQEKELYK